MHEGMVHRLINTFKSAFETLGVSVDVCTLEDLAVLVHKGMSVQGRNYHNLDHAFSLVDEDSPFITLVALFHDLVYCQVDMGFLPEIRPIIEPYVQEKDRKMRIITGAGRNEPLFQLLLEIFGFSDGQVISLNDGLNEFLSALVMVKKLEGLLPERELFKLILCVEASIPFRESALTGEDYFYTLERRALEANAHWGLGLSNAAVQESVKLAVTFANRDVESFAETEVTSYLETTWKLLPELNVSLRSIEIYSILEYRQALQAMEVSMDRLNPDRIFHQYRGVPTDHEYRQMVSQARRNIRTGQEYLRVKLLTQAILEALAQETGGDAPLSLFVGDLPTDGAHAHRLEDYLPERRSPQWVDASSDIYVLLSSDRGVEANFDLRTAPLSLFVFKSLSPEEVRRLLEQAKEMFAGRLPARDLLAQIDPELLSPIARASAEMVLTRREQLLKFA